MDEGMEHGGWRARMTPRHAYLLIGVVLALALVGCAGDGDTGATPNGERSPAVEDGPTEPPGALVAQGEQLATANGCVACHTVDGSDSVGPTWLGLSGSTETLEDGTTVEVDEEYLRESIVDPSAKIVDGFSDTMPKNFDEQLSDDELDAIIAYIRSLG